MAEVVSVKRAGISEVTLKLSYEEACAIYALVGHTTNNEITQIYNVLRAEVFEDRPASEIHSIYVNDAQRYIASMTLKSPKGR